MKYDCYKTLDCLHEFRRLCWNSHPAGCENDCPFCGRDNCNLDSFDEDDIAILQAWSDEHPEPIKLTRKEHDFLTSFVGLGLNIERRTSDRLYVVQHSAVDVNAILIDPDSFSFIPVGEVWYFSKLLNLEVEE